MQEKFTLRLKDILALRRQAQELELSHDAKRRLAWFEYYCRHGENVSLTCRYFGIARSTFLRWAKRFEATDPRTLEENSRRPKTVRQPETPKHIISLVRYFREQEPYLSKEEVQKLLSSEYGFQVSSATVGRIIKRHGFFFGDSKSHRMKRKAALLQQADDLRNDTSESADNETWSSELALS